MGTFCSSLKTMQILSASKLKIKNHKQHETKSKPQHIHGLEMQQLSSVYLHTFCSVDLVLRGKNNSFEIPFLSKMKT